ncbi:sigma-70 family RNA polymerase sigma factor [Marinilongibacter aquaticus]|uniref:sigma-70 family RNA polymerase sigma factor n=1 Tax=Marinilongibacter aquaticus TaxID=2975157 RepID=UPI0021BD4DB9|nr:sigma-70 family RNA polymerase sigma factor [Marinilongibacter aquaticus]UBM58726.1 sigma-70 family RNA polymerase sigma factor [Marinilongibacter aquaticus]
MDIRTSEGFEEAYRLYSGLIFGLCIQKVPCAEDAEEIVQELFRSVWERRHEIGDQGDIGHYLMKSAKYRLIDFYRKRERERKVFVKQDIPAEGRAPSLVEERLVFAELKAKAMQVLRELPLRTREIFLLSRRHGLTNKQIAHRVNMSEKSVEYHMKKALDGMKLKLSK